MLQELLSCVSQHSAVLVFVIPVASGSNTDHQAFECKSRCPQDFPLRLIDLAVWPEVSLAQRIIGIRDAVEGFSQHYHGISARGSGLGYGTTISIAVSSCPATYTTSSTTSILSSTSR